MEMQQVRYFLAVCEAMSFTRAAKRCGVSQPTLSNAIKRLEKTLGGPLFHRGPRQALLSALGSAVRPHLEQLDRNAAAARREAKLLNLSPQGQPARTNGARHVTVTD